MDSSDLTIGWVGTGVMGYYMCQHLMEKSGLKPLVYNRTASKADGLVEKGATFLSVKEIAEKADIVFTMLGYPKDVEEVCLGEEGLIPNMKEGAILIDHTTSSPALAEKIAEAAKAKGIGSIDAPVSGGDIGAKNGQVVSMCGGDQETFDKVVPLLQHYSK